MRAFAATERQDTPEKPSVASCTVSGRVRAGARDDDDSVWANAEPPRAAAPRRMRTRLVAARTPVGPTAQWSVAEESSGGDAYAS